MLLGPVGRKGLFNGNIALMAIDQRGLVEKTGAAVTQGAFNQRLQAARYDQLNRLLSAASYTTYGSSIGWSTRNSIGTELYDQQFSYDANGNILLELETGR